MKRLILLLVTLVFLPVGCSKADKEDAATKPAEQAQPVGTHERTPENSIRIRPEMLRDLRITTQTVESRPGGEGATLLGELQVNEGAYAEVGPPISARVVSILAAPGQAVEKGQALVVLQSVELGKARSDYITAQARLELAQKTLARKQKLAAERIVPQREVQEAETTVRSAEADVRAARAALHALGAGEDDSDSSTFTLRSPISGTVIERTAMQGQMADPAQPLFKIADLSRLWLTVRAFERDAVRVRAGGTARVTFPALPGQTFSGVVTLVGKQVDPGSRTVPVRIELANRDGLLRPGMSATAWVPLGQPGGNIVTVPTAALQRVQNEWLVFIPRGPDVFEMRPVGRGRDLGGEIEILSGLKPGEQIVVEGAFLLKAEAEKARGEGKHEH
jgi:cobalt-zinc-cadmium efflux system membrane fusion protein